VQVAVADDLQVEMIRNPSAGEHGVQLLPGLLSGGEAVHGVSGDPLSGMDRRRIAQLDRFADVVGREPDGELAAGVPDREVAVSADVADGPPVAVLHPISGREAEPAVVAAGDDHIADAGLVPVGQLDLSAGWAAAESDGEGAVVEVGDQFASGGEHDRIEPGRPVCRPRLEGVLAGGGQVADVHPSVVQVEVE
jgi:hypothetical protein